MKKVLAIDMGATSIRGIIGYIENGNLIMEEVMRLSHKTVLKNGRMRWQWEKLTDAIVKTINGSADSIVSVGIDTWGVDFGVLDKEGNLIEDPVAYRDAGHEEGYREALKRFSEEEIFLNTGTQIMSINTLFQLLAYRKFDIDNYKKIDKVLMLPDLIGYMLTGNKAGEETIWSTTQILNLKDRKLSKSILEKMELSSGIFPKMTFAGNIIGSTKTSRVESLRDKDIKVVSVCGHDTASAVLLTEAFGDEDVMFLSCGTWSLIGARVKEAVLTREIYASSLTNELGYDSATLLFKNITGLYLLEKFKAQLEEKRGKKISFDEITEYVRESIEAKGDMTVTVDMEEAEFAADNVNAKEAIDRYLKKNGLSVPDADMDYFRIIYESLVEKYIQTKESIEAVTKKKYRKLHIIGGGAKSALLCQLIADKMNIPVLAGPVEASALGNILIQLKAAGAVKDMGTGIEIALKSQETKNYTPNIRR